MQVQEIICWKLIITGAHRVPPLFSSCFVAVVIEKSYGVIPFRDYHSTNRKKKIGSFLPLSKKKTNRSDEAYKSVKLLHIPSVSKRKKKRLVFIF